MPYKCHEEFLIRIPSLPIEAYRELAEMDILSLSILQKLRFYNADFEEAISIASKDLIDRIQSPSKKKKKNQELILSIIKYYVRASTRPTPYGLFAGVALGKFGKKTSIVINAKKTICEIKPDAEWLNSLVCDLEKRYLKQLCVRFNNNCYIDGERMVNPYFSYHGKSNQIIDSGECDIRFTNLVRIIKENTDKFVSIEKLSGIISNHYKGVQQEKIDSVLEELVENEFLFTDLRIPAYCNDELGHVLSILDTISGNEAEIERTAIRRIYNNLYNYMSNDVYDRLRILSETRELMDSLAHTKNHFSATKGFYLTNNELNINEKSKIERFVNTLSKIAVSSEEKSRLSSFKNAFLESYGYNVEVSIIDVINTNGFNGFQYLDDINTGTSGRSSAIKRVFDEKIQSCLINMGTELFLTENDFLEIPSWEKEIKRAASFDLNICVGKSKNNNKELIFSVAPIGGAVNAGAIVQRFSSVLDNAILTKYNKVFQTESEICSGEYYTVEIREAYSKSRLSNLKNVKACREYCCCIGCCTLDGVIHNVRLDDIYIGLTNEGNLYLCSHELNKRVKFVTDNMINTDLNSSLLRLMVEISDEYEDKPLTRLFNYTDNIYYFTPRIWLEGVILVPKTWRMFFKKTEIVTFEAFKKKFKMLVECYKIDNDIVLCQGDNRLFLSLNKEWALRILYKYVKRESSLKLSEMLFDLCSGGPIIDENNNNYVGEMTFSFVNESAKTSTMNNKLLGRNSFNNNSSINRTLIKDNECLFPGDDGWIYLKLYGSRLRQNKIITQKMHILLQQLPIEQAFYIRYSDSAPHIRLRIKFMDRGSLISNLPIIMGWMNSLKNSGLIYEYTINPYNREINRYGGKTVFPFVESFFFLDSMLVVEFLRIFDIQNLEDQKKAYLIGITTIIGCLTKNKEESMFVVKDVFENLDVSKEFHQQKKGYMRIIKASFNREYILIDERIAGVLHLLNQRNEALLLINEMIHESINKTNSITNVVLSISHMFCNRLMGDNILEHKYLQIIKHACEILVHN